MSRSATWTPADITANRASVVSTVVAEIFALMLGQFQNYGWFATTDFGRPAYPLETHPRRPSTNRIHCRLIRARWAASRSSQLWRIVPRAVATNGRYAHKSTSCVSASFSEQCKRRHCAEPDEKALRYARGLGIVTALGHGFESEQLSSGGNKHRRSRPCSVDIFTRDRFRGRGQVTRNRKNVRGDVVLRVGDRFAGQRVTPFEACSGKARTRKRPRQLVGHRPGACAETRVLGTLAY
jgi:hypothetical protein